MLADEVRDCANKEQLAVTIRFVDADVTILEKGFCPSLTSVKAPPGRT